MEIAVPTKIHRLRRRFDLRFTLASFVSPFLVRAVVDITVMCNMICRALVFGASWIIVGQSSQVEAHTQQCCLNAAAPQHGALKVRLYVFGVCSSNFQQDSCVYVAGRTSNFEHYHLRSSAACFP